MSIEFPFDPFVSRVGFDDGDDVAWLERQFGGVLSGKGVERPCLADLRRRSRAPRRTTARWRHRCSATRCGTSPSGWTNTTRRWGDYLESNKLYKLKLKIKLKI